ncbi:hypothetical protein [Nostoc sp. CALU 1950]|uniref:hypothetical protein n=1 Tax=Nostoc sp. CALU 1950 TaxID=3104321 RepID=UPI003EC0C258
MASYFDLKGTTIDSFKIGKGGPTLNRSGSNIIKLNNTEQLLTEANLHPGYLPNKWYTDTILFDAFTASANTSTTNTVSYYPFQIFRPVNIVRFSFNQTVSTATALFRFGIYSNNPSTFLPQTLIASSAEITLSGIGDKGFDTTTTLTPGWYWKALNQTSGTGSFSSETGYPAVSYYVGSSTFGIATSNIVYGYRNDLTYTNATLPTTAVINDLTEITGVHPIMFFKTAS